MNERSERHGTASKHTGCSGARPLGESKWKFRAKSASLHLDHNILGELIVRRWKEDRTYLISKIQGW